MKKAAEGIVVYQTKAGAIELQGDYARETIWASQAQMARVFDVNPQAITKHLKNIYGEGELTRKATCSSVEQVRIEGRREVKRTIDVYNLDAIISVGYRIGSFAGTRFRQWATKVLRSHIIEGYTLNPKRIARHYKSFMEAVASLRQLLPEDSQVEAGQVIELIATFADTWFSLDAFDRQSFIAGQATKKRVIVTAETLVAAIDTLRAELAGSGRISDLFAHERADGSIEGIVGNVMQSFGGVDVYPTIEAKAAHLLYFMVKNHPFLDGNKRCGAFAFVWFLRHAGILNLSRMTPPALTALTLLIAASNPKDKDRMIGLVLLLLGRQDSGKKKTAA